MLKISESDRNRVTTAVHAAEQKTSGEIVTIVAERSDSYRDIVLSWVIAIVFIVIGSLAAFPASWIEWARTMALGWQSRIDHHEVLLLLAALLAVKLSIGAWIIGLKPVRLLLTPHGVKQRRVRARAIDYFRVGAEWRTVGRTAVLIYVSLDEHLVEIVADKAIHSLVPPETWGETARLLSTALRDGRPADGLVDAIEHAGAILAQHFPPSEGNPNELPDRLIEVGAP